MRQLFLIGVAIALGACTVTTDAPRSITIDSEKVTIHHADDRYAHRHKQHKKMAKQYKKHRSCPYGQAKKNRCDD